MESSKPPGFWQTVPGILTALAGVITAVAGLMVAYSQIRARSPQDTETQRPAAAAQSAVDARPSPVSAASPAVSTVPAGSVPAGEIVLTVGPPNEVRFKAGELIYRVLTARLEPFNQDTRLFSLNVRVINNMAGLDRNYYSELRALADDLPLAPEDPPFIQIEAHSVKDIPYMFRVPANVRTLTLRISRMEEAGDIPLHLK